MAYLTSHPCYDTGSALVVTQVVRQLVVCINRPGDEDEESLLVKENAVAAIGTLCVSPALSAVVERSQLLPLWLSNLPLKEVRFRSCSDHYYC